MTGRSLLKRSAGYLAVALLLTAVVLMVLRPSLFGDTRFDVMVRTHPDAVSLCFNRLEFSYSAQVTAEDGKTEPYSLRRRFEQIPVAVEGGSSVYQIHSTEGEPVQVYVSFAPSGPRVYRSTEDETEADLDPDLSAVFLTLAKTLATTPLKNLHTIPVEQRLQQGKRFWRVRGDLELVDSAPRSSEEILRCLHSREEETIRGNHRVSLGTSFPFHG